MINLQNGDVIVGNNNSNNSMQTQNQEIKIADAKVFKDCELTNKTK